MQKECRDCRHVKPLSAFPPQSRRADGRGSYCGSCTDERHLRSREGRRAAPRTRAQNPASPCNDETGRENRIRRDGSTRDDHLKRRYGLTSADVDALIAAQDGLCAIVRVARRSTSTTTT